MSITNGILVGYASVSVKLNGGLDFAGIVKIRGFDTFSRCKSRGGTYCCNFRLVAVTTYLLSTLGLIYEGWNFNSGNYLFATDTK